VLQDNVDTCYCEQVLPGKMIKQRSNTWSNLGFVLVGLIMLASLPAVVAGSGRDPMEERTFYAVLYGCVVIFLGPGSMFFHASMKKWGGWIDTLDDPLHGLPARVRHHAASSTAARRCS
jgi:hypothetical protein